MTKPLIEAFFIDIVIRFRYILFVDIFVFDKGEINYG